MIQKPGEEVGSSVLEAWPQREGRGVWIREQGLAGLELSIGRMWLLVRKRSRF